MNQISISELLENAPEPVSELDLPRRVSVILGNQVSIDAAWREGDKYVFELPEEWQAKSYKIRPFFSKLRLVTIDLSEI